MVGNGGSEVLEKQHGGAKEHGGPGDVITIVVDGTDHQLRPGRWIVSELKTKLGVDAAKVLAEITPQGLKDLDDDAVIEVHQNEKFMTHARSGGSS